MKIVLGILIGLFISIDGSSQNTIRPTESNSKKNCPTFIDGEFSFETYIFCDSTVYASTFSDQGGFRSDFFRIANWQWTNDSTILITKHRKKWFKEINHFYLQKFDKNLQFLVPDKSVHVYHKSIKSQIRTAIQNSPPWPTEDDKFTISLDSAKFYNQVLKDHHRSVLNPIIQKLDELDIFWGYGF